MDTSKKISLLEEVLTKVKHIADYGSERDKKYCFLCVILAEVWESSLPGTELASDFKKDEILQILLFPDEKLFSDIRKHKSWIATHRFGAWWNTDYYTDEALEQKVIYLNRLINYYKNI